LKGVRFPPKTDEYGKKETLQISKNIERNIAHFKTLNYF
jgi:hypothetical protein